MATKAEIFGDWETLEKIMRETDPAVQKKLGRQVKNFNEDYWNQFAKQTVYEGNYAKFTQNSEAKEALLATAGTFLVEASPYDKIWGIGMSKSEAKDKDPSEWKGTNWLGEVLTKLREDLIKNEKTISENT